jgi:hypothetical protein
MLKSTRRMLFFIPPSAVSASARSYRYLAQVHQGDGSLFHPPGAVFFNGKGKTMIREFVGFEAYEAACEGDTGLLGWSPLIPRSG